MEFDPKRPLYDQLLERFRTFILTYEWEAGMQIPTVRELAAELRVNPNTVQRALTELEGEGLASSVKTVGRFVTRDAEKIDQLREAALEELVRNFYRELKPYHVPLNQVIAAIEKIAQEEA